jgi:hypothetical protein
MSMKTFQEWMELKYSDWEKNQSGKQSYYTFARFLDVGQSKLTLWMSGAAIPTDDDLVKIAIKLGSGVYEVVNVPGPNSIAAFTPAGFSNLPLAFRTRLTNAISETSQAIIQNNLNPESGEAKLLAVNIFEKWGFKITR